MSKGGKKLLSRFIKKLQEIFINLLILLQHISVGQPLRTELICILKKNKNKLAG